MQNNQVNIKLNILEVYYMQTGSIFLWKWVKSVIV